VHEIAGHRFIPSEIVPDPSTSTYFGMRNGAAYATSHGPGIDLQGNPSGTRDYNQAAMFQGYTLQVGILSRLSVRLSSTAELYSGIDVPTALSIGVTAESRLEGGLTLALALPQ
jgi:hypothetical protein